MGVPHADGYSFEKKVNNNCGQICTLGVNKTNLVDKNENVSKGQFKDRFHFSSLGGLI